VKYIWPEQIEDEGLREAIRAELERAIAITSSPYAHLLMGTLQYASGDDSRALASLARVLEEGAEPLRFDALVYSAQALRRLGRLEQSLELYRRVLALREDPLVLVWAGQLLRASGSELGERHFERAIALDPLLHQPYAELIELHGAAGESEEVAVLRRRLEGLEASARQLFEEGVAAQRTGDLRQAAESYRNSIRANPSKPAPYMNLGYVYLDSDGWIWASRCFRLTLELDPRQASAHYGLGLAYKRARRPDDAIAHFERYLEAVPSGRFAERAAAEIFMLRPSSP
jgi:tetratricopeptide (TPR) repeat protein